MHGIALGYITLRYVTLHYVTLHDITHIAKSTRLLKNRFPNECIRFAVPTGSTLKHALYVRGLLFVYSCVFVAATTSHI